MSRRRIRREQGQTMVEFALVMPVLCVVLFAIIQFGVLYNDYLTLTDATRVGARKAIVSGTAADPTAATVSAVRSSASNLDQARLTVLVSGTGWASGSDVTVEASYPYTIALFGLPLASGQLKSRTTERVE